MSDSYCLYHKNNKLYHGWIKGQKNNKFQVVPIKGNEFLCSISQTEYSWKGKSFSNEREALDHLEEKVQWINQRMDEIDLLVIHELCEKGRAYLLDELSELFLERPEDPWERVSLLQKIKDSKRLFQQKKDAFIARTNLEVEEYDNHILKEEFDRKSQELEQKWIEDINHNYSPKFEESEEQYWFAFQRKLKSYFLNPERDPNKSFYKKQLPNLDPASIEFEQMAVSFLRFVKAPISWGRFLLERNKVTQSFSEEALKQIEEVREKYTAELSANYREDLTHLETFTVDGELTYDYDDALSFVETEMGYELYVHIADVASFIDDESPLFEECSKRITSVYTLKHIYPMLPEELSEKVLSLVEKQKKCAVTYRFQFDNEYRLLATKIFQSVIFVKENLSYETVDERFKKGERLWETLFELSNIQKNLRINNGGLDIKREEILLDIRDETKIKLINQDNSTPAYVIVQELALMVNFHSAKFCIQNQVPVIFRGQEEYSILGKNHNMMLLTMADIKIRPAKVSLTPIKHCGLGLDFYVQASSPIRRLLDLLAQKSIINELKGVDGFYNKDQLYYWSERSDQQSRSYSLIQRTLINHWKFKYLKQNKHKSFEVRIVKSIKAGNSLVSFEDLQLITEVHLPGYKDREKVHVSLEEVDVKLHRLVAYKR